MGVEKNVIHTYNAIDSLKKDWDLKKKREWNSDAYNMDEPWRIILNEINQTQKDR